MIPKNLNNELSLNDQTIVALCSPKGSGAVGLIRLSGVDAFLIADKMSSLVSNQKISSRPTHTISYGFVVNAQQEPIDQVLFLVMHGPKTFTGQNIVEITCHNNQFLIEQIIDRAIACGARVAGNGEFTQRAVMLGKIDLIQAEAINDLIHAQSAESLKYSLAQLQGSLSSWVAEIENATLEILAFCEASFEFLDEEMEFGPEILKKLEFLSKKIETLLTTYPKQQYIKEGVKIALVGSANAGKSSLFNALLDKNRSIVTPIAGTTRDSIEAGVYRDGQFFTFIDTAGIRETQDVIEQYGIDRSFEQAAHADILLLIIDSSTKLSDIEINAYNDLIKKYYAKIILIHNKIDLPQAEQPFELSKKPIQVSTKQPETIKNLYTVIHQKTKELKDSSGITCLLNQRQHDLLINFHKQLNSIVPMVQQRRIAYELVIYRLQEALQSLSDMTGRDISQAAFDKVFSSFCVGK